MFGLYARLIYTLLCIHFPHVCFDLSVLILKLFSFSPRFFSDLFTQLNVLFLLLFRLLYLLFRSLFSLTKCSVCSDIYGLLFSKIVSLAADCIIIFKLLTL